ncbi:MAG TPA: 3'-5' exonuclease [Chloroflexota bacterium]|nr:3'-5' exonuclease [Chloroflexota bacterium]
MARKLDRIVVVDVEATCWDGTPPVGQESEIIEIGVCTLDVASLERAERRGILVRPQRSTVSPFCTQLTTLTQDQVAAGVSFAEACALLVDVYRTRDRLWASYGDYDRRQFERQCHATGTPYPFGSGHLNVKTLFAIMRGLQREVGMDEALRLLGLPLEGTHHRGGDDVWNIAALLATLLASGRTSVAS